jgi:hypothetical protein
MFSIKLLVGYFRSMAELCFRAAEEGSLQAWLRDVSGVGQALSLLHMKHIFPNITRKAGDGYAATLLLPIPPGGAESLSALLLMKCFHDSRWCPVRARQLCRLYDYAVVGYLARVRRQDPDHVTHRNCENAVECVAYNLTKEQEKAYKPKHTTPGCACVPMNIMKQVLVPAIMSGAIPIISMDPLATNLDIRLHRQSGVFPYTAISHVWSDGLGNPHANTLPTCQLRRIASILSIIQEQKLRNTPGLERWFSGKTLNIRKATNRRVAFWMDTLCIPCEALVNPDGSSTRLADIKHRAIMHITPIYQGAEQVLVLDSELEQLSLDSANIDDTMLTSKQIMVREEELTARILGCKWLQRAWTLEEGALARECLFKIAGNKTITLGELLPSELVSERSKKFEKKREKKRKKNEKKSRRNAAPTVAATTASSAAYDNMKAGFQTPLKLLLAGPLNESRKQAARPGTGKKELGIFLKSRPSQFVDAWNNLLERSATKPNDREIIFANILDFNAASISKIKEVTRRLPVVVKSCEELPLSLFFNARSIVRTSGHPRDSWIPSKIEGDRLVPGAVVKKWKNLSSGQEGLRVDTTHCPTPSLLFLLARPKLPFSARWFCVEFESGHDTERFVVEVVSRSREPSMPGLDVRRAQAAYDEGEGGTCVMIDKSTGSDSVNGYTGRGARCSVLGNSHSSQDKNVLVRYDSPVIIWSLEQWRHKHGHISTLPEPMVRCDLFRANQSIILEYGTYRAFRGVLPLLSWPSIPAC